MTEMGVLNEGVIGNRLLRGSPAKPRTVFGRALGQAGLLRFDRDVLVAKGYFTLKKETLRQELDAWIRGAGEFDGVIDADQTLQDPSHPARMLPSHDSGDHLHPNDAGDAATGDAIPLSWFADH